MIYKEFYGVKILSNYYDDDFVFYDENKEDKMVDISGGNKHKAPAHKKSGVLDKKKKIVIICSAVAVVVIGAIVAGVCLISGGDSSIKNPLEVFEFKYSEDAEISGVSIGGKTYDEALSVLSSKEKDFIEPVSVTVDANGKEYKLTQDDFEYEFDTEDVLTSLKNDEENGTNSDKVYEISAVCTEESIKSQAAKIKEETDVEPVNARVSKFTPYGGDSRFKYEDAKSGYTLDADNLEGKLASAVNGGQTSKIVAVVTETEAEIDKAMVKKNTVLLATYSTVSYNTANGTENMGVALEACNGSVIEPGGVWSFNECTGDSNLESNGYKPATVIANGKLEQGIGGGICQASSTIYNAAIRANLDVEERYPHLWASTYVPTGLDATIDYPNLDLKLSNPTDYQMFLECKLDGTTLKVSFWGYKDSFYDEIQTENEIGSVSNGEFSARAWRVYYKDGKEVDREELPSSTYDSKNGTGGGSASNDPNVNRNTSGSSSATSKPTSSTSATSKPASSSTPATSKPTSSSTTPATSKPKPTQATEPTTTAPPTTQAPTAPTTEAPTQPTTEEPAEEAAE